MGCLKSTAKANGAVVMTALPLLGELPDVSQGKTEQQLITTMGMTRGGSGRATNFDGIGKRIGGSMKRKNDAGRRKCHSWEQRRKRCLR